MAHRLWHFPSVCLLILATVFFGLCKPEVSLAQTSALAGATGFNLQWMHPAGAVEALAISPQGQRIAMVIEGGKLSVWTVSNGMPLWSHDKEDARDIAVSDGVGYVLAYNSMSPLNRELSLMRADTGVEVWKEALDSAIWAAAVSHDGMHAVVATGKRTVYDFTLDPQPRVDTWQASGICDSLAFAPNNEYLVAGLWNVGGVECFGIDGKKLWQFTGRDDRRYDVSVTQKSGYVLALGYANHKQSDGVITLLGAADGSALWNYSLGADSYYASALSAPEAETTVATFAQVEIQGRGAVQPRRLLALNHEGNKLWDKGGLFFSPTLLCLTPNSNGMVVYDGSRTLYLLDSDGHIVNHAKLSGMLRKWAVSADNDLLVIYTGDGQLSLYKLD